MKIVVPISASDIDKLDRWLDVVIKYGNLANHSIELLPTPAVSSEVVPAAQRLTDAGIQCNILQMRAHPQGGWPQATNVMFFEAVRLMAQQKSPWFWMEPDCLPVRSNWADVQAAFYASCGAKFLGCIVKTPWRDEITGKIVKSPDGDSDDMMCGNGIYPADMAFLPELQPLLNDLMKGPDSAPQGFDIYLRYAIKKYGRVHSALFEDKWNSEKYVIKNGVISCSPVGVHEGVDPNQEKMGLRSTIVSPQSATVHGCKDSSLHDLIMDGLDLSIQSTEKQSSDSEEVTKLRAEMEEMRQMMASLKAAKQEEQAPPKIPDEPEEDKRASKFSFKKAFSQPKDHDRVLECLQNAQKRLRIGDVSKMLKIPLNKLKTLCEAPHSAFEIGKGPAGWMKIKDTATT